MTKGKIAMPAVQWVATLGSALLFALASAQMAHAQQKTHEFKFNLKDC